MRFTLYFPDRPVYPDAILASLGSIQPYVQLCAKVAHTHIRHCLWPGTTRVLVIESPKLYP